WKSADLIPAPALCFAARGTKIFCGFTNDGVARSLDGGNHWSPHRNTGLPSNPTVRALVSNGTSVFAAVRGDPPEASGIYRSHDDGDSWTLVGRANFPEALAINGSRLIAGLGPLLGVYVSND